MARVKETAIGIVIAKEVWFAAGTTVADLSQHGMPTAVHIVIDKRRSGIQLDFESNSLQFCNHILNAKSTSLIVFLL